MSNPIATALRTVGVVLYGLGCALMAAGYKRGCLPHSDRLSEWATRRWSRASREANRREPGTGPPAVEEPTDE